jgi:DNA helicase-2/ATP-dependent DNA helicase PcrA
MERRVAHILRKTEAAAHVAIAWSGTFHAIGARLLREFAHSIGLDPAFTIHDRGDSEDLMNLVRHQLELSEQEQRFPLKATCLSIYSKTVNSGQVLDAVLKRHFPWVASFEEDLRRLFEAYVAAKQAQQVLDYDDLLLYWAELMKLPEHAGEIGAMFDHVLVDEYQDTNAIQASILLALKPEGKGLTVVGNDAQSIYGFRAAEVRNILDFPEQFSPPAALITLDQNYRSTVPILNAANAVIALAKERFTKDLWSDRTSAEKPALVAVRDDAAQAGFVVERVLANREDGVPLKEQAVLFRASHHSAVLEIELSRRNIPFVKFGGLKFLEAAHIKDLLALLRWAENPLDRMTGFRVLQLCPALVPALPESFSIAWPGARWFKASPCTARQRARRRIGPRSASSCSSFGRKRQNGQQRSISCAPGINPILNRGTPTLWFAPAISISSPRSRRAMRRGKNF